MRLLLLPAAAVLLAPAAHAQHTLNDAGWLIGCWEQRTGERLRVERWYEPAGGAMRGTSRSFNGGTETAGERLRLTLDSGALVYAAHPSSQSYTEFRARTVSRAELVFENPAHDFPQRIIYRPQGTDSLLVQVEGDRDGRQPPISFRFRKAPCEPGESPADVAQGALQPLYDDLARRLASSPGALAGWLVEHAAPGFSYVSWTTGGYAARAVQQPALERAARAAQSSNRPVPTSVATVAIDGVNPVADTAEVMVTVRQVWRDSTAAGGPPAREVAQRRLDRWVHANGGWRLASAAIVAEEVHASGRMVRRDGRPVPAAP